MTVTTTPTLAVVAEAITTANGPVPIEDAGLAFSFYDEMVHRIREKPALVRVMVGVAQCATCIDDITALRLTVGHYRFEITWPTGEVREMERLDTEHVLHLGPRSDVHVAMLEEPARVATEEGKQALADAVDAFKKDLGDICSSFLKRPEVQGLFASLLKDEHVDGMIFQFMNEAGAGKAVREVYDKHREAIAEAQAKLRGGGGEDTIPLAFRAMTITLEFYDPALLRPGPSFVNEADIDVDFYTSGLKDRVMALGYHEPDDDVFKQRAEAIRAGEPVSSLEFLLKDEERHFVEKALPRIRSNLRTAWLAGDDDEPYLLVDTSLVSAEDRSVRPVRELDLNVRHDDKPWPRTITYRVSWTKMLESFGMADADAPLGPRRPVDTDQRIDVRYEAHKDVPRADTWSCTAAHAFPLVTRRPYEFTPMHPDATPEGIVHATRKNIEALSPEEDRPTPMISHVRESHSLILTAVHVRNCVEDRVQ